MEKLKVGDYYTSSYFSRAYNSDILFIYKIIDITNNTVTTLELNTILNNVEPDKFYKDSKYAKSSKKATPEQIQLFKKIKNKQNI